MKPVLKTGAGHYSYDIHGNVKSLLQDNPALASITPSQQYKKIDYNYDLVSGNVNAVHYQNGQPDQFHHRYEYDADNRITNVYTSKDNVIWDQDAKYFYYPHGVLARTEIGDLKAQGLDYAYTINGWVKGINSESLNPSREIGHDGNLTTSNIHLNIARDVFGNTLNYYPGDYIPINSSVNTAATMFNPSSQLLAGLNTSGDAPGLFNGNISSEVVTIPNLDPQRKKTGNISVPVGTPLMQLSAHKFDQLNRLKQWKPYEMTVDNSGATIATDNSYNTTFSYDANGNIKTLTRNGTTNNSGNLAMDDLHYYYKTKSGNIYDPLSATIPADATNKLAYIDDAVTSAYNDDIDAQQTTNYDYTEIGELKKDAQAEIREIQYNVYGRVKKLIRTTSSTRPDLEFRYDANSYRIAKIVKPHGSSAENGGTDVPAQWTSTYYTRDAQGNAMAVYLDKENDNGFYLEEHTLFGSQRLGMLKNGMNLLTAPGSVSDYTRTLGNKRYELSSAVTDNTHVVITDRKIPHSSNNTTIDYYEADPLIDFAYYHGIGPVQPHQGHQKEANYRYGAQGSEVTEEWDNDRNHITTFHREGELEEEIWLTNDPVPNAGMSPYQLFSRNGVLYNDVLGDKEGGPIKDFFKGVGNVLSGSPWGAKHKLDLGAKIKGAKEWAFVRHSGGIVTENYLDKLKSKADKSDSDPDLGWAKGLHEKIQKDLYHDIEVKDPGDLRAASTSTDEHYVPDVPKSYQAEFRPVGPLAGGMQLNVLRNDKSVFSATGFADPGRQTFKVLSSDDIKLNLSRMQPQFNNIYSPSGTSVTTGNTLNTVNIIPSFTFQLRLQIKQ